jgi:ABC-2 type transport system permease protein
MVGIGVVPHLMFEEKQARTLDVLLVSPASSGQVVLGKAFIGLFYCLVSIVVVFALYPGLIVHWSLAILAAGLLALFATALGLLVGIIFDTRQQFIIWTMPVYAVLLLPAFLVILSPILPGVLNAILPWVPTVALLEVVFASCGQSFSWAAVGQLAYVAGWTALVLAAVALFVRRSDR